VKTTPEWLVDAFTPEECANYFAKPPDTMQSDRKRL
jgi:hypothetical protein